MTGPATSVTATGLAGAMQPRRSTYPLRIRSFNCTLAALLFRVILRTLDRSIGAILGSLTLGLWMCRVIGRGSCPPGSVLAVDGLGSPDLPRQPADVPPMQPRRGSCRVQGRSTAVAVLSGSPKFLLRRMLAATVSVLVVAGAGCSSLPGSKPSPTWMDNEGVDWANNACRLIDAIETVGFDYRRDVADQVDLFVTPRALQPGDPPTFQGIPAAERRDVIDKWRSGAMHLRRLSAVLGEPGAGRFQEKADRYRRDLDAVADRLTQLTDHLIEHGLIDANISDRERGDEFYYMETGGLSGRTPEEGGVMGILEYSYDLDVFPKNAKLCPEDPDPYG